jgi:septal ring-binding cell division protein DamX
MVKKLAAFALKLAAYGPTHTPHNSNAESQLMASPIATYALQIAAYASLHKINKFTLCYH